VPYDFVYSADCSAFYFGYDYDCSYNFNINKQKGDKKSHHKSYQGISKPQQNIAENGLSNTKEEAAIDTNHPITRVPNQKKTKSSLSFWGKIKSIFGSNKKKKKPEKNHNNKNNRNRNKNLFALLILALMLILSEAFL
jgi:hypothetical protein